MAHHAFQTKANEAQSWLAADLAVCEEGTDTQHTLGLLMHMSSLLVEKSSDKQEQPKQIQNNCWQCWFNRHISPYKRYNKLKQGLPKHMSQLKGKPNPLLRHRYGKQRHKSNHMLQLKTVQGNFLQAELAHILAETSVMVQIVRLQKQNYMLHK